MAMKIKDFQGSNKFKPMKIKDFQGSNKFKPMKKSGVFFTIDSILAAGIIFIVVMITSSSYVNEQLSFHINYISQDVIKTLSTLTVEEMDNEYINSLIDSGDIKDKDNTVLEQIAEFWADNKMDLANRTASNVTEGLVPASSGFGIWVEDDAIYIRDAPLKNSLVSSKKIISGIEKGKLGGLTRKNPPTLLGPVVVEARVWQ